MLLESDNKFAVIIPAAGKSTRFRKHKRKKPFVELKKRPIWLRSVEHFVNREDVCETIVVIAAEDEEFFREKFRANLAFLDVKLVIGGKERADSVKNALDTVSAQADYVAIHDAARPLLTKKLIDAVFAAAIAQGAAILADKVTSTVKRVSKEVIQESVARENLWLAQTPQVFRKELLVDAYAKAGDGTFTDEASILEAVGIPVKVVPGASYNLKITNDDDFRMAEAMVDALPRETGLGTLHPFADESPFNL